MQWIKGVIGGNAPDKQENFMIGSDRWTGSSARHNSVAAPSTDPMAPLGSFKNPEAAQNAVQAFDAKQQGGGNPYVQHAQTLTSPSPKAIGGAPSSTKLLEKKPSKMYPDIFQGREERERRQVQQGAAETNRRSDEEEEEEEVLAGSQTLVRIPGAIVHLIDNEDSIHLGTGDFSLVRLVQEKSNVDVVICKVGSELQWPLVQEEATVKLDPTHYFFTLKVPTNIDDENAQDASSETDILNYGVTFPSQPPEDHAARIRDLDLYLERYSLFSAPTLVQGEAPQWAPSGTKKGGEALENVSSSQPGSRDFPGGGTVVPQETVSGDGKVVANEETEQAFWTTIAPNVNDYNHKMARGIAYGAGHIIRGIFWVSDSAVEKLSSGSLYMHHKFKTKEKKTKISPLTMSSVRRVRKLSQMTDRVAAGVLGGLVYTTGLFSSAVVNSVPGKTFFKLLPGEVALVSLDAFSRVFDAIEKAGRDVLTRSSSVTQEFVNHRYGESAKELTDEGLRTVGHVAATAWTITKIRKALNPNKGGKVSKTGLVKNLAKQAAGVAKKA